MKTLAFLLAILVFALSVMPCADKGTIDCRSNTKTEIAKPATPQSDPLQDDCSPFCHCTCCAGFSINHSIASIVFVQSYIDKANVAYMPASVIKVSIPIWQPPKLLATIIS